MTDSVLSINEGATSIALKAPSNLVKLERHQMWDKSSTEPHHLVNPPSRNQRCFRYLDCFDGGQRNHGLRSRAGTKNLPIKVKRIIRRVPADLWATFKAVYLSSQFDRKTDCFDGGQARISPSGIGHREIHDRISSSSGPNRVGTGATFKAVCGTQTRHGVSVNKYQADSQSCVRRCWPHRDRCQLNVVAPQKHVTDQDRQKSGIGMAADKSSPIREPTRKRKSVPGIGYRQGKSFSYACNEYENN